MLLVISMGTSSYIASCIAQNSLLLFISHFNHIKLDMQIHGRIVTTTVKTNYIALGTMSKSQHKQFFIF